MQQLLLFMQRSFGVPAAPPYIGTVGQIPSSAPPSHLLCVWQEAAAILPPPNTLCLSVCLSLFHPCWALASSPEEATLAYVRTLGLLWLFPAALPLPLVWCLSGWGEAGRSSCCFQALKSEMGRGRMTLYRFIVWHQYGQWLACLHPGWPGRRCHLLVQYHSMANNSPFSPAWASVQEGEQPPLSVL